MENIMAGRCSCCSEKGTAHIQPINGTTLVSSMKQSQQVIALNHNVQMSGNDLLVTKWGQHGSCIEK